MAAVTSWKTLYSNVACFTTHESNLSCNKLDGYRLRKVESSSTFCKKICTNCARFTGPRQTCFAASNVTRKARLLRNSFQSESNMQATCTNLICCETGLNVGGKMRNVFVVRLTIALSIHGANHSQKRNVIIKHFIVQLDL